MDIEIETPTKTRKRKRNSNNDEKQVSEKKMKETKQNEQNEQTEQNEQNEQTEQIKQNERIKQTEQTKQIKQNELNVSLIPKIDMDIPVCSVCCEEFNSNKNQRIVCPRCPYEACKQCHKRYLLNSIGTSHCMNCRHRWTHKDLLNLFKPSFINAEYRRQRGQYLLDRAKSHIPRAMPYAEADKKLLEIREECKKMGAQVQHLKKQNNVDHETLRTLRNQLFMARSQSREYWQNSYRSIHAENRRKNKAATGTFLNFEDPCPINDC